MITRCLCIFKKFCFERRVATQNNIGLNKRLCALAHFCTWKRKTNKNLWHVLVGRGRKNWRPLSIGCSGWDSARIRIHFLYYFLSDGLKKRLIASDPYALLYHTLAVCLEEGTKSVRGSIASIAANQSLVCGYVLSRKITFALACAWIIFRWVNYSIYISNDRQIMDIGCSILSSLDQWTRLIFVYLHSLVLILFFFHSIFSSGQRR